MFIDDVRAVQWRMPSVRTRVTVVVALIVLLLVVLQLVASRAGFQGPLHSLVSDFVATPKTATVAWVGLGVAMVGVSNRWRLWSLSLAAVLDAVFASERLLRGGVLAFGNGPTIVLTGLTVLALWRWTGDQRSNALRAIAFGILLILATKVGDTWLRITAIARPTVWDEYALLADHALAQPSWLMGRLVDAAGPAVSGLLRWVYIELPAAALVVALYQLRHVTTSGWPRHFLMRSFLVLGLVGPVIYILFPIVGPVYAFSASGEGFQVGDYWSHALPPVDMPPAAIAFDSETARNCMPSMHTAWAMAVFLHTREGPRWLRWGGTFWLAGTLTATLGYGYHYGVDLIAGAVLCMTVESALRQPHWGGNWSRVWMVAAGSSFLVALLLGCRFLAEPMAQFPVLFGPLLVGGFVIFSGAFYATFFSQTWLGAALRRVVPQGSQAQPEYG
ncbi:MAG TPA: DUF5933 domain-containing protein [Mycobacterium sp.]|nr:DUF5933 domain-containing protein [Mycobacterium sp.]